MEVYGVDPASRAKVMQLTKPDSLMRVFLFCFVLFCFSQQDGFQPIHYASEEVAVVMLINDFHVKPDAKTDVGHYK